MRRTVTSGGGIRRDPARTLVAGADIGGTFTDICLLEPTTGRSVTRKVLTTHRDPGEAVLAGLAGALGDEGLGSERVTIIVHATTLATNALIERTGARTGDADHQRFPRRHRDRLRAALRPLRHPSRPAPATRSEGPAAPGRRTNRERRRTDRGAPRRERRCGHSLPRGARGRIGRGLLPARLRKPGERAGRRGPGPRARPGPARLDLVGGPARARGAPPAFRPPSRTPTSSPWCRATSGG